MTLSVRTRKIAGTDGLLDAVPERAGVPRFVFLRDGEGLVASGVSATIEVGTGPGRLASAGRQVADLAATGDIDDAVGVPGSGLVAMGSFTFDPDAPGSILVVPRVVVGRRAGVTWRTEVSVDGPVASPPEDAPAPPRGRDRVRFGGSSLRDEEWLAAVARAVTEIGEGRIEKVVLARDQFLWARGPFDVGALVAALDRRFPGCFTFAVDGLVGASPELLLRRSGLAVASRVLAGTAARGRTPDEDRRLAQQLLGSDKDRREHALAVSSVTEVLARLCDVIDAPAGPELLRLPNVQHLATDVAGTLSRPLTALELLDELHPTAAVGGTPRDAALRTIRELEGMSRGRYAGPVGWTDARGDGEWAIALRCAEIDGARARLLAGAGVVAGSLPEQELIETTLKFAAMRTIVEEAVA